MSSRCDKLTQLGGPNLGITGVLLVIALATLASCKTAFTTVESHRSALTGVSFAVSPDTKTVTLSSGSAAENMHAFCFKQRFTGTITNSTGSPIYLSATNLGTVGLSYFKHDGVQLSSSTAEFRLMAPAADVQLAKLVRVADGDSISFTFSPCPINGDGTTTRYSYEGTGDYTFVATYHYAGSDGNADGGVTDHDTLTSNEVVIHAN